MSCEIPHEEVRAKGWLVVSHSWRSLRSVAYRTSLHHCSVQTNKQTNKDFSLFPTVSSTGNLSVRSMTWLRPPGCEGHLLFFFWRFPPGCVRTSESITWCGSGDTPHPPPPHLFGQTHLGLRCTSLSVNYWPAARGMRRLVLPMTERTLELVTTIFQRCRESVAFRVTGEIALLFVPLPLRLRRRRCNPWLNNDSVFWHSKYTTP